MLVSFSPVLLSIHAPQTLLEVHMRFHSHGIMGPSGLWSWKVRDSGKGCDLGQPTGNTTTTCTKQSLRTPAGYRCWKKRVHVALATTELLHILSRLVIELVAS